MKVILLFLLLVSAPLFTAQAQTRFLGKQVSLKPSQVISLTITFASAPTSAGSVFAVLKYNKDCAMSLELDDNSGNMNTLFPLLDGGTDITTSITYTRKTFTDGCGNAVPYRAGLAVNARSWLYNTPASSGPPSNFNYDNIVAMVSRDWSLLNHGYYHETTNNFSLGRGQISRNLRYNDQWWYDILQARGLDYRIRTMVVPSGSGNYVSAADSMGYVAATSQGGTADNYPCWQFPTVESVPNTGYTFYGRWLGDQWGTALQLTNFKAQFDLLLSSSTPSAHKLWRWFGHGVVSPNINTFVDYVASTAADRVWVVGLHEYAEYQEMKRVVKKTEVLTGTRLVITLDLGRVPATNRFRDMSLLVKSGGVALQSVTVTGADAFSYNQATGLVNVFKKKTAGFARPTL